MAAKGDVELIIRARNEASKNVDQINRSLKELADQQAIVGDSAGKADDSLSRLGLELAKLRTNAQNLRALSNVAEVVDKATLALNRQQQATAEASTELERVTARQKELARAGDDIKAATRETTAEFKRQDNALKQAKTSLGDLGKEATSLAGQERSLISALGTAQSQLQKREQALQEAATKQAALTQAIAGSEKVTKAQQSSLDAANRALERRQKAVAETVAKEAALQQQLTQIRAAMANNTAASLNANAALTRQQQVTDQAAESAAKLKVEATGVARAQRDIAKEVQTSSAAVERQAGALQQAESEYSQLQAAATTARNAVAGTAASTKEAGGQAARAAIQVASLAAKLAVLSGSRGSTSAPTIIDPAGVREAVGELARLGVTIRAAGNDAAKASVSTKEMEAALKGVGAAQAQLQGISSGIAAQRVAVDGAQQAWKAAEAEVRRLAVSIREANAPSETLAAAFGKAQGAARLAKDEFLRQQAAADKIAQAMGAAGIGVGTLASAEAALVPRIQQANEMMALGVTNASKLGVQVRKTGTDASGATAGVNRLANALGALASGAARMGNATNPLRAFKNELTAMIAASAGLYAIQDQLRSIWQVGTELAANQSKFATAFGGVAEGNQQLAYAREVALNLKLPLATLTKSYADLALAAKGTALEGKAAQDIFVAFAQTARVNGSTADDLSGTYRALTQIMSKGKVQAEELRGQLGDRMPGAMQLMAEGLGITTEKLDKMMEKGELTRQTLLNMAAAASGRVSAQLAAALASPAAKLQDFQNRLQVFKETIAGSGFLDAVAEAFDKMAKALSTPEAAQSAKLIGEGLADMVTWATQLATSGDLDTILAWVKGLGTAWAALQITSLITSLYGMATAIGVTTIAVLGLDVALAPVLVGIAALSAAIAVVVGLFGAWKLAEWAYDNFPAFAEGVLSIKNAAQSSFLGIQQFWEMTAAKLKNSFSKFTAWAADNWYAMLNSILGAFPDLTKALGLGDYANEIAKRAEEAAKRLAANEGALQQQLFGIRAKFAAKQAGLDKDLQDQVAKYHKDRLAAEEKQEQDSLARRSKAGVRGGAPMAGRTGTQLVTADPYVPDTSAADEKAAKAAGKKRAQLEQSVANEMFTIRAQLEKKSAETLDQQLAAIPAKYAKLFGKLTALGKDKNDQDWKDVEALVAQEQAILRQTTLKKQQAAADKAAREAGAAEDKSRLDAMRTVEAMYKTRQNLQEQLARAQVEGDDAAVVELQTKIAQISQDALNATNGMIAFWQATGEDGKADVAIAKLEQMRLTLTKINSTAVLTAGTIAKAFGGAAKGAMDNFVDSIANGTKPIQAMKDFFIEFARTFLINIAKMILQQMLLNAISGAFGNVSGTAGGYMTQGAGGTAVAAGSSNAVSGVFHDGGIAGNAGRTMAVDPQMFRNAIRYHTGGTAGQVPGLAANEVPAVLERGEEILTTEDPRHSVNGGGGSTPVNLKMINMVDSASVVSEGLNTVEGEEVFMNIIKANRTSIRSILG